MKQNLLVFAVHPYFHVLDIVSTNRDPGVLVVMAAAMRPGYEAHIIEGLQKGYEFLVSPKGLTANSDLLLAYFRPGRCQILLCCH